MSLALAKSRRQNRFHRKQALRTVAGLAMENREKEQATDEAWLSRGFRIPDTVRPIENYLTDAANISWPSYKIVEVDGQRFIEITGRHYETVSPYKPLAEDAPRIDETLVAIPDEWTPEHVRSWMRAALETIEKFSAPSPGLDGGWAFPILRNAAESYGYGEARAFLPPSKGDIDRMDIVLPHWLTMLDSVYARKVVMAVAKGLSYRRAARLVRDETGRRYSYETARTTERKAIETICDTLNNLA